ncbi:hypothetical protein TanjilG_21516 [Lupinus angustifolius]|uniref:Uncharacterized protein n=1 Tax=Lupinus angustifolius TaxID=3871 RepID=A0A4P1QUC1_LUPAN|nr:PREDICTED: synaptonemal complex protein 1-like isoform X1 [Lupinus angustifolius]OIV95126.1 hypothetical protein TanjilG_21516 [Lupinus angustifolius]
MAKKKMSNQSKQQHQQQQQHEENVSQPQPTPSSDNNNKLETLKNLNSLLLKETTKRRQQVESLESHLSNTVDDNVVSELEKSVAFAFIKSRVEELGFVFSSDKNDMSHVVSELGFEVEELKNRLSEVSGERDRLKVDFDGVVVDAGLIKEKVREGEIREEKVVEELRKVRSEWEKLIEEGLKKEKVIEEVIGERDSAVSKWRELNEKVVEAESRENKLVEELREARVEGEKLGFERERVIVEVREERDSAVRESRELKEKVLEAENNNRELLEELQKVRLEGEKLIEEGGRKERVINEVTVERDSALSDSRELKEKVLEAENSNRKLLDELQKMRLEVENLLEEGSRKDRVIGEVTVERDLAVRDSRELKEKVLEAENSNKKLLEELQKVRLEGEKLIQEGSRKERVIGEVKVERDLAVRDSRELKEKLLEAENSNKRFLEELQKVRLEGEKLFEEGSRKDRLIGEVTSERESAVRSLRESTKVIEKLKEEIDLVTREKDEISKVNDAQKVKISSMELELVNVSEALNYVSKEEKLMKGKLLELEDKVGIYEKKEEGLMLKIRDLVKHKEEVEGSVEMLKEGRDSVEKVLGKVRKELEDKQREIENVKVSYVKEITEVQNIANELNQSGKGFEKKNSELLSEVESYKNAVKEVTVERDNIRKGFEEEKNKVKSLMLQVAEMEGKIEALAGEIGMIKSEKVKLLEKNETVESRVSVLIDEKDALQRSLLEAQQECDEVRAKVEFYSLNSNQVLEMLKNAAALVSQDMEGEEDVVSNEQKPEEEIRLYAEQLGAIRDAFRNKNKMVADMKQQSEVLQKSVHEAHQMKSLWTMISSGASVLAAAFAAAYVAKGH